MRRGVWSVWPRLSLPSRRSRGSRCGSWDLSVAPPRLVPSRAARASPAEPGRRGTRLHRVTRLIIYRVGHPRIGFHESHVERDHGRYDTCSHQHDPVTPAWATVPETQPATQIGYERPERGEDHDQQRYVAHVEERELGQRRDRVEAGHRGHEAEEPDRHPTGPVRMPLRPEVHGRVGEHDQHDDQDKVYEEQIRGVPRGEPGVSAPCVRTGHGVLRPGELERVDYGEAYQGL